MTTISELYRSALHDAATFARRAQTLRDRTRAKPAWGMIDQLRDQASRRHCDADYLAHCIAAFGDLDLSAIDLADLRRRFRGRSCGGYNPWARGLSVLKAAIHPEEAR